MPDDWKQAYLQDIALRNRYFILAVILIGLLMGTLDGFMVNIALPTITTQYNVSLAQSQWAVTGYLLSTTGLFIFFGKVSEHAGKARLFTAGWVLFTLSSLACGLSSGLYELVAFRVIQGIGYSMVSGVASAMIYQVFPPQERGRAMGYYGTTLAFGALLGPVMGGFITDLLGWQYIFLVNVPIGAALLCGALKYLKIPESKSQQFEMEWPGAILLIVSIVSLLLFCGELADEISITLPLVAFGALFALSSVALIAREARVKKPLLELSIFRNKHFTLAMLSMAFFYVTVNMVNIAGPFYFQGVMGYTPAQVGLIMMLVPLAMAIASSLGGWLYDKRQWKFAGGAAMLITAMANVILGYAAIMANLALLMVGYAFRGIGSGLFQSPNNTEIMSSLPMDRTAIASSTSATARNLGWALGVSVTSIIFTLEMSMAGYGGAILSEGRSLLSNSVGMIMAVAVILSILSAAASFMRNYR